MMPRPGDVVEIVGILPNDPDPLPIGLRGTVTRVTTGSLAQITVTWHDSTRTLMLLPGDPFIVLDLTADVPMQ